MGIMFSNFADFFFTFGSTSIGKVPTCSGRTIIFLFRGSHPCWTLYAKAIRPRKQEMEPNRAKPGIARNEALKKSQSWIVRSKFSPCILMWLCHAYLWEFRSKAWMITLTILFCVSCCTFMYFFFMRLASYTDFLKYLLRTFPYFQ